MDVSVLIASIHNAPENRIVFSISEGTRQQPGIAPVADAEAVPLGRDQQLARGPL
jgi:hypothetical protein